MLPTAQTVGGSVRSLARRPPGSPRDTGTRVGYWKAFFGSSRLGSRSSAVTQELSVLSARRKHERRWTRSSCGERANRRWFGRLHSLHREARPFRAMAQVMELFEYENRRHGVSDSSPLNQVRITLLGSCVNAAFGSASASGGCTANRAAWNPARSCARVTTDVRGWVFVRSTLLQPENPGAGGRHPRR